MQIRPEAPTSQLHSPFTKVRERRFKLAKIFRAPSWTFPFKIGNSQAIEAAFSIKIFAEEIVETGTVSAHSLSGICGGDLPEFSSEDEISFKFATLEKFFSEDKTFGFSEKKIFQIQRFLRLENLNFQKTKSFPRLDFFGVPEEPRSREKKQNFTEKISRKTQKDVKNFRKFSPTKIKKQHA